MKTLNLIGEKYGRLLVIADAPAIISSGRSRRAVECRCDCGIIKVIKVENLRDGSTKSCGCLNDQRRSERAENMYRARQKYDDPATASAAKVWQSRYRDGDISFEDFLRLSQEDCHYCNTAPANKANTHKYCVASSDFAKGSGDYIYNGLDRLDSNLPHNINNVVPCCMVCNLTKSDMPYNEFIEWIKRVFEHINSPNFISRISK